MDISSKKVEISAPFLYTVSHGPSLLPPVMRVLLICMYVLMHYETN